MFNRRRTYLDFAAASPILPRAARAMQEALLAYGNPSSPHAEGREAKAVLEDARASIAKLAGVKADAVIFTGNATEANALAIEGAVHAFRAKGRAYADMHALYLPSAHSSTIGAIDHLKALGVSCEPVPVLGGKLDPGALASLLRPETVLVAFEAVCGETGARFDTRGARLQLDAFSRQAGTSIRLHVDASQLPFAESFARTRLACDTLSLDAQKVGGVRGVGALIAPRNAELLPLMLGGGQERGLRPGTEATMLAAAFAAALASAEEVRPKFAERASAARTRLLAQIAEAIPDALENRGYLQVPHILNISFPGRDTDYLAALLDEAGFAVSTRSACETDEPGSRAVLAFTGDGARAASALRISWGPQTATRDLDRLALALIRAVRFLDANAV